MMIESGMLDLGCRVGAFVQSVGTDGKRFGVEINPHAQESSNRGWYADYGEGIHGDAACVWKFDAATMPANDQFICLFVKKCTTV
jgi:hypothetical protein